MTITHKRVWFWVAAVIATLFVAVYQRVTGPSYPLKGIEKKSDLIIRYKLPRSAECGRDLPVTLIADGAEGATMKYRRLNSHDDWTLVQMERKNTFFQAQIPSQPPAGKVEFMLSLQHEGLEIPLNQGAPVIVRFRGAVPPVLLILHIVFMFASLLLAIRCLFAPLDSASFRKKMAWLTTGTMFAGGMILGPLVQKYAFGHFWTGLPFGTDLTDNKTLFVMITWVIALMLYSKRPFVLTLAAVLTLIIFLIPHSVLGSELDHRTGQHKNTFTRQSADQAIIRGAIHGRVYAA